MEKQEHQHIGEDGTVIVHTHVHTHTQTKAVLNRMSRLIGHMESIKKMVENGRDCSEVLIQLSAVSSALRKFFDKACVLRMRHQPLSFSAQSGTLLANRSPTR